MTVGEIVAGIRRGFGRPESAPPIAPRDDQADLDEVFKRERRLGLRREGRLLKRYRVALGFAPERHKERKGDGRTPEGTCTIDARNPHRSFHLSLGVSYPYVDDRAHAAGLGVPPGGDICTHGLPNGWRKFATPHPHRDWTTGCIAVTDVEIRELWSLVSTDAKVVIHP